jgi:FixJ family two-component response regulator
VSCPIISIVDDDEGTRLATVSLVRSLGWQARGYASADEFLNSGEIGETSCLISDIFMPGMSGIDMHTRLLDLGHELPTIFITALPSPDLKATVRAKGTLALALLEKPIDANAIEQLLNSALGQP